MRRRRWGLVVALVLAVCALLIVTWRVRARDATQANDVNRSRVGVGVANHDRSLAWRDKPRASVSGTVSDAKGPIPKARVCARAGSAELPHSITRTPQCTNTDARGAFAIGDLHPATYSVSAVADHHLPGHLDSFVLRASEQRAGIDLILQAGGIEIVGTVSDLSGGTIAHAAVATYPVTTYKTSATVETDAAGAFRMWVAPGNIGVSADADGYTDSTVWGVAPGVFEIALTPESVISGTVIDARTRVALPSAKVILLRSSDKDHGVIGLDVEGITDEQGRFRFDRLFPDRYSIRAIAARGFGLSDGSIAVGLGQQVDDVVVEAHPAVQVEGVVRIVGTPDTPCPTPEMYLLGDSAEDGRTAHANTDGSVRADGVLPGSYQVRVDCEGHVLAADPPKLEVGDQDITGLTWRMIRKPPRATIRGHLRTGSGAMVSGASVAVASRSTTTKSDGSYELGDLDAGTHYIGVETDAGIAPKQPWKVDVAVGATVVQDLTLDPGGAIVGTVIDSDGKPAARVNVTIMYPRYLTTTSGDDGSFRFDNVDPGRCTVDATEPDGRFKGERVTVRANQTTTVKLVIAAAPGKISGVVVDAGGKPLGDAFVVAAREIDGRVDTRPWLDDGSQVLAGVDGTFTVTRLVAGSYMLRAYRTGGGEATIEHVPVGGRVRIQIKPTGSIAGTVRTLTGAPMDITVSATDTSNGFSQRERFYRTGGRYHLDDLPAGEYRITVSADEGEIQTAATLVEGARLTGVDITINAAVTLVGRVVDLESREPVPDLDVNASLQGLGRWHVGHTAADGRFKISVPRGQLDLHLVGTKDSGYEVVRLERSADTNGEVDLGDLVIAKARVKRDDPVGLHGLRLDTRRSLRVVGIVADSPAASTEIVIGDVVTAINGTDVTGIEGSAAMPLLQAPPGTRFRLGLARGVTVTLVSVARETR